MIRSFVHRLAVVVAATGGALACTGDEAPKVPLAQATVAESARAVVAAHAVIGPAAKAALDSGNALYRRKAYPAALERYRAASALAPQHAAPFFGIYMVARATNQAAAADSALAAIRLRNGPLAPAPHSPTDSVVERMHEVTRAKAPAGRG